MFQIVISLNEEVVRGVQSRLLSLSLRLYYDFDSFIEDTSWFIEEPVAVQWIVDSGYLLCNYKDNKLM